MNYLLHIQTAFCMISLGKAVLIPPEQLYIKFYEKHPSCPTNERVFGNGCWHNSLEHQDYNCRLGSSFNRKTKIAFNTCKCCGLELYFIEQGYACTRYCTPEYKCKKEDMDELAPGCCKSIIYLPNNFGEPPEWAKCNGEEFTEERLKKYFGDDYDYDYYDVPDHEESSAQLTVENVQDTVEDIAQEDSGSETPNPTTDKTPTSTKRIKTDGSYVNFNSHYAPDYPEDYTRVKDVDSRDEFNAIADSLTSSTSTSTPASVSSTLSLRVALGQSEQPSVATTESTNRETTTGLRIGNIRLSGDPNVLISVQSSIS